MKLCKIIYLSLSTLLLLSLAGCQGSIFDDESTVSTQYDGVVVLTLGVTTSDSTTRSSSDEAVLGEAEYAIGSLRIMAFHADGTIEANELLSYYTPRLGNIYHELKLSKAESKDLYFVANEPEAITSSLESVESLEELEGINFTIAEAMNGGFNAAAQFSSEEFVIPMSASKSIEALEDGAISVGLNRAVARVDLMLDKSSNSTGAVTLSSETTFIVNGVTYDSSLIEGNVAAPLVSSIEGFSTSSSEVTLSTVSSNRTTAARVLSFYLAERTYDAADVHTQVRISVNKVSLDGELFDVNNSIILGESTSLDSSLSDISRNTVYRIYATLDAIEQEVVADDYAIVDWVEVPIFSELEGVTMAIESTVAMDWYRNRYSFSAPTSSFGSNKPVTIYLPVVTGYTSEGYATYDYEAYDFTPSVETVYNLKGISLEGISYLKQLDWLESATLVFTTEYTGYFQFTYSLAEVHVLESIFPVRFKSNNIIKQMTVVYDNGYVPGDILQYYSENWPGAINGIVLAMRGYCNNPQTATEVYWADSEDGLYKGEYALTAAEAEAYCKSFGDVWYLPNVEQLKDIRGHATGLGTSYRFQNTEDAYYWSSTQDADGNYMVVNMGRYQNSEEPMAVPASQTHYIRCVANL